MHDAIETLWHVAVVLVAIDWARRYSGWQRALAVLVVVVVAGGLIYHVAITQSCHDLFAGRPGGGLCRWG